MASQNRRTQITSVSLSPEFMDIIKKHKISPSEVMRRGIAVTLYDLGEHRYLTSKNKERSEYSKEFLKSFNIDVLMKDIGHLKQRIEEAEHILKIIEAQINFEDKDSYL